MPKTVTELDCTDILKAVTFWVQEGCPDVVAKRTTMNVTPDPREDGSCQITARVES